MIDNNIGNLMADGRSPHRQQRRPDLSRPPLTECDRIWVDGENFEHLRNFDYFGFPKKLTYHKPPKFFHVIRF